MKPNIQPPFPPIPGLGNIPYLTNETIFDNDRLPQHLAIVEAGPVGIEMVQAHRRLGAPVTVIEAAKAMPNDDPELTALLLKSLEAEGVQVRREARITSIAPDANGIVLTIDERGRQSRIEASHVLVAAGRRPRLEILDLDRAGVAYSERGIAVDQRLRTTARGVYAIGDVIDGPRFAHAAGYQAGIVIRNALFRLPAKVDYAALPRVTYTDPELAQVGAAELEACRRYGNDIAVIRYSLAENDRAQAERSATGMMKIVARRNGRVIGASLLGAHAGELSHLWVLPIERRLKLRHIAGMLAPYPTWGKANKMAAAEFYKPRLFSLWIRRAVRARSWLP